jgi:hypothetical protein
MLTIDKYRKEQAAMKWQQQAEAAWQVFVTAYPAYNSLAIKGFMLDNDGYWHGDDVDTQGLLESLAYHEAAGHFSAMPDEWVEQKQLRDAQEAEEARKQRKGILIRELLGLQKEHSSPQTYDLLSQKYPLWTVPQLEQELSEVIARRELSPLSKEQLHKFVKKANTPIPDMSTKQIPADVTPSVIKKMSPEQIRALNRTYGERLVDERLGVKPRVEVGSVIRGKV